MVDKSAEPKKTGREIKVVIMAILFGVIVIAGFVYTIMQIIADVQAGVFPRVTTLLLLVYTSLLIGRGVIDIKKWITKR